MFCYLSILVYFYLFSECYKTKSRLMNLATLCGMMEMFPENRKYQNNLNSSIVNTNSVSSDDWNLKVKTQPEETRSDFKRHFEHFTNSTHVSD